MFIEQIIEFELMESGSPGRTYSYKWQNKNLSRNIFMWIVLLFTAKILQEAMYLTSPYLDQITYKI